MIYGNWIAIRKSFSSYLPDDRPYTKLEAVVSIAIDFDNKNPASYSGYSKLWKWSRNKVKKFMDDLELTIENPSNEEEVRLQKGKIKGHPKGHPKDNLDSEKGQPLFVFDKALYGLIDNLDSKKGQPKDTPKDTTIDPIKILDPTTIKKSIKKKSKKPKTDPPGPEPSEIQNFMDSISEATKNLCREKGIGQLRFKQFAETCFDHFRSKEEKKADWEATVRNWIRNDEKFNSKSNYQNSGISIADRMNQESEETRQNTNEIL